MTDALVGESWRDTLRGRPVTVQIVGAGLLNYRLRIVGERIPLAIVPKDAVRVYLARINQPPAAA